MPFFMATYDHNKTRNKEKREKPNLQHGHIPSIFWNTFTDASLNTDSNLTDFAPSYSDRTTPCDSWPSQAYRDVLTHYSLIKTQEDINNLLNCKSIARKVLILPNPGQTTLNLSGIEAFEYGLTIHGGASLTRIIAPDLVSIDWSFTISDLPNLESLEIPKLRDVQSLGLVNLPKLRALSGTHGISQLVIANTDAFGNDGSILITSTGLEAVKFVKGGLMHELDGEITISNNTNLTSVVFKDLLMVGRFGELRDINITNNHPNSSVSLPDLTQAKTMTITHVGEILVPVLEAVESLSFEHNSFQTLSLPELQYVSNNFTFSDNNNVNVLDLTAMTSVGNYSDYTQHNGIRIEQNMALTVVKFSRSPFVYGITKLIGNFSSYV